MPAESAPAPVTPTRIAVIGGGITGLAAAHRLVSQSDRTHVTLFEASQRLGGIIRTEEADGFLMELGPDSFITNKSAGLQLCQEIGFADHLISTEQSFRRSLVLRDGKPLPVPDGFQLMVPSNPWAVWNSPVLSLAGRLRLLAERFVPPRTSSEDESLESFAIRRFGRQAFERLIQPLVSGIYTADPAKLSLEATLPRFVGMERSHGSVIRAAKAQRTSGRAAAGESDDRSSGSGARYGLFTTAAHGLGSLVAAAELWLKNSGRVTIRTGCEVAEIRPDSDAGAGWTLKLRSGPSAKFDAMIIALPTYIAARLMRLPALHELAAELNGIEYASSAIVLTGHRLSDFAHPMDAFGLVIPTIERRNVLAVSFSSRKFANRAPERHLLLRSFVGGAMQPELLQRNDEAISAIVNDELRQIFGMSAEPMFGEVVRYNNAMPQYHVGHLDRVARIAALQSTFPGLQLAGNAFSGVGIPDSIASGRAAADRILVGAGLDKTR